MKYMRPKNQQQRDFLSQMASMASYLEQAFAGLSPEDQIRNGVDGSFSPIEHIWHLVDLEQQGFAHRIGRLQTEICPDLEDFAGARIADEGNYEQRSLTRGLTEFRNARNANLAILHNLDEQQWLRRGTQQGVGRISMCDMPILMAEHDDSHRNEITAWLEWQETTG